jgi:hypothetical protein
MTSSGRAGTLGRAVVAWSVVGLAPWLAVSAYALVVAGGGGPYQTADWLISYAGGFVRRGLFGTLYLALFPAGQAGLWVLFAVQVLLYAVPIGYAVVWLARSGYAWLNIALVCGPAAWAFTGWDPLGFARKESLALTALTLLAIAASPARKPVAREALVAGGLAAYAVAVFSWEGNALLLPGVAFLVLAAFGGWVDWTARVHTLVAAVIAVGGLGLSVLYPGTSATGAQVCAALQGKGLDAGLCGGPFGGAIGYLGKTPAQMIDTVGQSFPLYWGYLPWLVLGLLPLATTTWVRRHWGWALASALALVPLFVIAADYGRWITLLVLELLICLMATEPKPAGSIGWSGLATVLYLTTWGIPHWTSAQMRPPWPWLGAAKEITNFLIANGPHG